MKHHIIAKFNESVSDKMALIGEIAELYTDWRSYPFISDCHVIPNVIDRPNRYDLMIIIELERNDLPLWDASDLHKAWKANYNDYLEKKAIFDCE